MLRALVNAVTNLWVPLNLGEFIIVALELGGIEGVEAKVFVTENFVCMSGGNNQAGRNSGHSGDGTIVKVKFTLEQTTKAQRGSRGIAILFL